MCGGGGIVDDVLNIGTDILLTATGNPELIPVANGIEGAIENPKNPLLGGLEGVGEGYIGNAVGNFAGDTLGIHASDITGALGLNDAFSGASDFLGLNNGFNANATSGGLESGGGFDSGSMALSATGAPTASIPTTSGGFGTGGFQNASSVLSSQNTALDALSGGSNLESGTNLGSITGGADTGGSLSTPNPGGSGGGVFSADIGQAGQAASGFESGGGLPPPGGSQALVSNTNLGTGTDFSKSLLPDVGSAGNNATLGTTSSGASSVADSSLGSQALDFLTKGSTLKAALPLSELAYSAIKGPQGLPSDARPLEQGGAVTAPLLQTEQESLNAYNSGTLTAPQQAQIDQYTQQATNALYQQLAASGVTDPHQDSRFIQGMQQIQQQAQSMKQQILSQDFSAGTGAAGQAAQNLSQVAQMQNQADEEYQNAINEAIQNFSSLEGGGSVSSFAKLLGGNNG